MKRLSNKEASQQAFADMQLTRHKFYYLDRLVKLSKQYQPIVLPLPQQSLSY
jgi:hypothetical protein